MKPVFKIWILLSILIFTIAGTAFGRGDKESGRSRRRSGNEAGIVIRWFGIRMFPDPEARVPEMLEALLTEKLGYPVEFEMLGGGSDNTLHPEVDKMLAANELPDVFQRFNIDPEFLEQAAAKFELQDMFFYMPQLTKYLRGLMNQLGLDEFKTWNMYQDDEDNRMWGVPRIWEYGWVPSGQMWRKDILDELGYDIPQTIGQTEAVFEAYKSRFPDKYAMGGSGKEPTWQCFDMVFNAYGLVAGGQHDLYGTVMQFYAAPEFRNALSVLERWYQRGFIDPSFINHSNRDKFARFARGDYLVTEWLSNGSWDYSSGGSGGYISALRNHAPDAVAVAATHIAADTTMKPIQRVWNPFLDQLTVIGKHLEKDTDRMHKIMQVGDLISQDRDVKFLAGSGIEGVHYKIEPGETAPTYIPGAPGGVADGYGFYWSGTFSTYGTPHSRTQRVIDEYVLDPNGVYGTNNLDYWFPLVTGPVTRENGEPIEVSMESGWFDLVVSIITGERPLEYYDEWLKRYYNGGGRDWEENATRLYGN